MRIHDCPQLSDEWYAIRAGKFTATVANTMITPTGRRSERYRGEIARIVAEKLDLQLPKAIPESYWMERGTEMEAEARRWFTVETGLEVERSGFAEHESGLAGFSPDGLIFTSGSDSIQDFIPCEFKCPMPSTHIQWLLNGGLPKDHRAQVHFQMVITGSPYAWFMSYAPGVETLLVKVERDSYTETLEAVLNDAIAELKAALERFE